MQRFPMTTSMAEEKNPHKNSFPLNPRFTLHALLLPILTLLLLTAPSLTPFSFANSQASLEILNADLYCMPIPIQLQLNAHTARYVNSIANNIIPNPTQKKVVKRGEQYIARYLVIDTSSAKMEALPFVKGKPYKAIITYHEMEYQCCGMTKEEALNGQFEHTKTRRLIEILQYTQGRWR